jgi:formate dehydrogenase subunit gamma
MQKHYCGVCNRILPSAVCPVHGDQRTMLVNIAPVKLQSAPHAPLQANSTQSGVHPDPKREQQDIRPRTPLQVRLPASKPPTRPVPVDLARARTSSGDDSEILRFRKSERMLHWAIAIPFMVCWLTSVILVFIYNPDPARPLRDVFAWAHRLSGVCLIAFPILVMFRGRSEYRVHLYNIKSAWLWSLNDLKWLALMGLAAVSKKIVLPEQGKFNAAEKVNFMSVMVACPIFIVTGLMIWLHQVGWAAWLLHSFVALMVSPTMLGHIYMATVNPDTRVGLKGMISGYVDRQWARHHYRLWYKENFERRVQAGKAISTMLHPPDHRVHIHCPSCAENMMVSWTWILQKIFAAKSVLCPKCGVTLDAIRTITNQQELEWIQHHLVKLQTEAPPRA